MSTALIYTSPARGHLYPMMDVVVALQAAGHRVVVQTLAEEDAHLTAAGVEHRALAPSIEAIGLDDYRARGTRAQLEAALSCWLARAEHEVDDLRMSLDEVRPDLVVVDANCWGAAALAESTGRPWAMFLPYCLPVPGPDVPAFGPGFAPPRTALDRLRDRLVWGLQERMSARHIAGLNLLRSEVGVPPLDRMADLYLRADVLLYRTAEPFEYHRRQWPANVHLIGPGLWAPPAPAPDWLDELPRPRVLVSVSTELQEDGAIIDTALGALAEEPGSIIVTTSALDPARFVAPHERTRIVRFLPHAAVLPDVDLVITHGGMGTTQRALAAGIPLVVVPWGRDQKESARRVELCGAGVQIAPRRLTGQRMRRAVRDARGCTPQARAVADAFAGTGGAEQAVQLLEALLVSPRDPVL